MTAKRFLFVLAIFSVLFLSVCVVRSGAEEEKLTITTYYPSPYGVYKTLRLFPQSQEPDKSQAQDGELYFDDGSSGAKPKGLYYYDKDKGDWVAFGGAVGSGDPLVNSAHTADDCAKAGGEVVAGNTGMPICRFNAAACPTGWTRYSNFSTTKDRTCSIAGGYLYKGRDTRCTATCTSHGHSWQDKMPDCCVVRGCYQSFNSGYCFTCPSGSCYINSFGTCLGNRDPNRAYPGGCWTWWASSCKDIVCSATVTQIGCY